MSKGFSLSPRNDIFTKRNYSTLALYTSKYKVFNMSKVKELQYPDECARCKVDACSDCGYKQKRADAIDKYEKQFCKLCGKFIKADVNKYPDEFDKNLCSDCNVEYVT